MHIQTVLSDGRCAMARSGRYRLLGDARDGGGIACVVTVWRRGQRERGGQDGPTPFVQWQAPGWVSVEALYASGAVLGCRDLNVVGWHAVRQDATTTGQEAG